MVSNGVRPCRFLLVGGLTDSAVKVIRAQNLDNDSEPYAALSYCWGQDQLMKTTSANKAEVEDGIPITSLPKTITDAIRITRELGVKLLWVDSLCLVQDEENDLAKEIANMHHYYGNAYFTISAATASSCSEGFLQNHAMPREDRRGVTGPFYFPVGPDIPEQSASLGILRSDVVDDQAIDSRAWTLQEGLLSHRLVSFTPRIIRWSCRTESYGKNLYDQLTGLHESLSAVCRETTERCDHQLVWRKLKVWTKIVNHYVTRALSHERDRLPAISGIASVLSAPSNESSEQGHRLEFAAGLLVHCSSTYSSSTKGSLGLEIKYYPQDHFESGILALQLLWARDEDDWTWAEEYWTFEKHGGTLGEGDAGRVEPESQGQDSQPPSYSAPSWSWASHKSPLYIKTPQMKDEVFDFVSLTAWEQGLRVREVCATPRNSESPYGALSRASITVDGRVFRLEGSHDKTKGIRFDERRQDIAPVDCRGLVCLPIVPKFPPNFPDTNLLECGPQGLVLEPVESGSRCLSDERTYRRVGVYWIPLPRSWPDMDRSHAGDIQGTVETVRII